MNRVLTASLALFMMLPAAARAEKCENALLDISDLLASRTNKCKTDNDCASFYFHPAPCERAVILPEAAVTSAFTLELVKLQDLARTACKEKWQDAPACSSIPAKPVCREDKCVDELAENGSQ